jgi:hypothetical protein
MNDTISTTNSTSWLFFVKLTFGISIAAMVAFIFFMSGDLLTKGYLALNSLFIVSTTIMMSKTLRDEHENTKLANKISEAKTNKILKEYSE